MYVCMYVCMYVLLLQIGDRKSRPVELAHPDLRDSSGGNNDSIKLMGEFIGKHFKGVATTPSIVEPCLFTVRLA